MDSNNVNKTSNEESSSSEQTAIEQQLEDLAIGPAPSSQVSSEPLLAIAAAPTVPAFMSSVNKLKPNDEFIGHLLEMGFSIQQAKKALFHTNNESVQAAINWILSHSVDDTEEDDADDLVGSFNENMLSLRMTYVVNCSLEMGVGKVAAQVAHGAVALFQKLLYNPNSFEFPLHLWKMNGETKIVLRGDSADHLRDLQQKAEQAQLPTVLIEDAGRTQIPSGSVTVLALFGTKKDLQPIVGHLKLL